MGDFLDRNPFTPEKIEAPTLGFSKICGCIIPIAQIAVGSVYLAECPRQNYIPIYLIVMGVFSLVLTIFVGVPYTKYGIPKNLNRFCNVWNFLSTAFIFAWFIAGNVWIYSIYEPSYVKNATNLETYCNRTVYLFAFWTTTLVYILLGLIVFIGCCVIVCLLCSGQADPDDNV